MVKSSLCVSKKSLVKQGQKTSTRESKTRICELTSKAWFWIMLDFSPLCAPAPPQPLAAQQPPLSIPSVPGSAQSKPAYNLPRINSRHTHTHRHMNTHKSIWSQQHANKWIYQAQSKPAYNLPRINSTRHTHKRIKTKEHSNTHILVSIYIKGSPVLNPAQSQFESIILNSFCDTLQYERNICLNLRISCFVLPPKYFPHAI